MSEAIWCNIWIKVPPSWNGVDTRRVLPEPMPPHFINTGALCNGEGGYWADDHWHLNGEGNYGLMDDDVVSMLVWCRKHNVPFVTQEDAKYEWLGSTSVFDGEAERFAAFAGEAVILDRGAYHDIVAGNHWAQSVEDYFALDDVWISSLSIDHLPAECPEDEETSDE